MKVDALSQHSPLSCRVDRIDGQLLANVERRGVLTLRRVAHEVHQAGWACQNGQVRSAQNESLRVLCAVCFGRLK